MSANAFNLLKFKTIHFGKDSQRIVDKANCSGILMIPKEKNYSSYLQQLSEIGNEARNECNQYLSGYEKKVFSSNYKDIKKTKLSNHSHPTKSKFAKKEEITVDSTNNLKQIEELIKQKLIKMNKRIEIEQSACEVISKHSIYGPEITLNSSNHTSPLINIERIHNNYSKTLMLVHKKNFELSKSDNSNSNVLNNSYNAIQVKTTRKMTVDNTHQSHISLKLNDESNNLIGKEKYRTLKIKKEIFDSLDEEEELDEDINYFYISAENNFIFIFDFLIIIFTIYSFIFYPIYIAKSNCFCLKENYHSRIIKYLNEIIFLCDLIISFFREYYNYELELVNDNQLIIFHYLQEDFILDLLEAIPFYFLSQSICNNSNSICTDYSMTSNYIILRLLNLLKILKIFKVIGKEKNKVLRDFYKSISDYYCLEKFTGLAIFIMECLVFLHVLICLHIFFGRVKIPNWIISLNMQNKNFGTLYITSLYFNITTLTTVGYGDIVCHSIIEIIFQIILLGIGIVAYSFIISKMGNYVKNKNLLLEKMKKDTNMLEEIRITYPLMPFDLYHKINDYLTKRLKKEKKLAFNILITALPYSIKRQLLFTVYQKQISNFIFFKNCQNSEFIFRILSRFIPITSKKGEYVIHEKEKLNKIIFVKEGSLSLEALINSDDPESSITEYIKNFKGITRILGKGDIELMDYENIANIPKKQVSISKIKHKIDELFVNQKLMQLSDYKEDENDEDEEHFYKDFAKMDIEDEFLDDQDIEYHYLKIMEIRKNEHFGDINIFLDEPSPLSLKVKTKICELLLLRKSDAISISNDYPNIWKKLQIKSYYNLFTIKKLTFKKLKRYMETFGLIIINEAARKSTINQLKFTFLNSSLNNINKKRENLIFLAPTNKMKKKRCLSVQRMTKSNESNLIKKEEIFSEKSASIISNKDGINHIYVSDYSLTNSDKIFNGNVNNINSKFSTSNINNNNNNVFIHINNNKNNTDYRNLSQLIRITSLNNFNNKNTLNFENESKNKTETSESLDTSKNISKSYINETQLLEKTNSADEVSGKTEKIQSNKIEFSQGINQNSIQNKNIDNYNEHIPTMNNMSQKYITRMMKKMKGNKRKEKIKLICQFVNLFKEDGINNEKTDSNKIKFFLPKENNDDDKNILKQKIINQIINIDFREDELLSTSFMSDTEKKYFNEKELILTNENQFEIKSDYPNLVESTKGKIIRNKKYRMRLLEVVDEYIYNNNYGLNVKKNMKKSSEDKFKTSIVKNFEDIKSNGTGNKKIYNSKSSKKLKIKSSAILSNKYKNKKNKYENIKDNINVKSEVSNNYSNDYNYYFPRYTLSNKIINKRKQNIINHSKILCPIDSHINSSSVKSSNYNLNEEKKISKKSKIPKIFYSINHDRGKNQSDINNDDISYKYNPSDFFYHKGSFFNKDNNIYKKYFDFKTQTKTKTNKNDNNDDDLKKKETEDKNLKTICSRSNNLETNNIMRTNNDDGIKDFAIKKKESNSNLKNKNNCIII